ncbi:extracellular solute-binding protein [Nocardioides terrisoli]|uniref:extracellular solute-binding protein n=1 Tax=Nocardioides terrisoli TaxID=3388267 RepID=UPI00287B6A17|nr:extracellular solute-binding protein [Nocardioides marmorisolisilvae]
MVRVRGLARVAAVTAALAVAVAGCTPDGEAPPQTKELAGPALLSVAVYGPPPVIAAYTRIAADFTEKNPNIVVNVKPYDSRAAELKATREAIAKGHGPNLFLIDGHDLSGLVAAKITQPVDELLGERQVDFGDGYSRDALEAFSSDAALQCMPTAQSPLVVYYNTRLVDLTRAQGRDGNPISADTGWTFEQFARAARQASHGGHRGVYVAPDLDQVAPFIWSGGGQVVDNVEAPTTLTLSSGQSVAALQTLLELVRKPRLTYDQDQLARRSALQRFKSGQLAMILGYRGLTPQLRQQENLHFDVLPLPKLGTRATTGDLSGMCMSRNVADSGQTADFLAYLVSDPAMAVLARTGYVMPTNLSVISSDAFLQPAQMPASASVFADQVRRIRPLPTTIDWPPVAALADRQLNKLFYEPVVDPLLPRLTAADQTSAGMLAPPTPSGSPSPSESGSPTSSP